MITFKVLIVPELAYRHPYGLPRVAGSSLDQRVPLGPLRHLNNAESQDSHSRSIKSRAILRSRI